jgi:hypothetical protein
MLFLAEGGDNVEPEHKLGVPAGGLRPFYGMLGEIPFREVADRGGLPGAFRLCGRIGSILDGEPVAARNLACLICRQGSTMLPKRQTLFLAACPIFKDV